MKILNSDLLLQSLLNDSKRNNNICFLFGSAISYDASGKGVPAVSKIIEIIREYLKEQDIYEGYEDYISTGNSTQKYQLSFEFLLGVGDQNDVKEIMRRTMEYARNDDGSWYIPQPIKDISTLINSDILKVNNILTTNFDPLFEEALKNTETIVKRVVLDTDSNIGISSIPSKKNLNIIHLHGFWEGDTMHTPNQLLSVRNNLKSSLKQILSVSKLYVIGYGGWDDIFNFTLSEIMHELKATYDVRWAFYNPSEPEIVEFNKSLISTIQPALVKGRFNAYKGIDCEKLFSDLVDKFHTVRFPSLVNEPESDKSSNKNSTTEIMTLQEIYSPKKDSVNFQIKKFDNPPNHAHETIRITEQNVAIDLLNQNGSISLICGWGYGKFGFISSFLTYGYSNFDCYRVDLSGLTTKEECEKKIISDIGVDFTTFFATSPKERCSVVIFDNIIDISSELRVYLNELVDIINDYEFNVKAIFISSKDIALNTPKIEILPLSLSDTNEYIKDSNIDFALTGDELDGLYRKTSGLPSKLDVIKAYLEFTNLKHILSSDSAEFQLSSTDLKDSIPSYLIQRIIELSKSESNENKRIFSLLIIFSILECGELPENIIRFYNKKKFKLTDFSRLISMGLIYSTKIKTIRDFKVNRINPLVKDYIRSLLSEKELQHLRKEALFLVCGDIWKNRYIKVSHTSKTLLDHTDFHPGNIHLLLISSLKQLGQDDATYNLLHTISISYCSFLKSKSKFKELVLFSKEVHSIPGLSNNPDHFQIVYYLSEGLRMLDHESECISLLEKSLDDYIQKKNEGIIIYKKELHFDMMATLARAYEKNEPQKAQKLADFLIKNSHQKSYYRFLGESIMAEKLSKTEKVKKLASIAKKARNNDNVGLANNICLDLARLIPSEKDVYVKLVLSSERSVYTKVRALLANIEGQIKNNKNTPINSNDKRDLISAYQYLFIQRIDVLFNRAHSILWDVLLLENNTSELFELFLTSSLVWRVNKRIDKEITYAESINKLMMLEEKKHSESIVFISRRYNKITNESLL